MLQINTMSAEETMTEEDESFSPMTKMRIARLLQKQGDTKEALRLQYEVMQTESKEDTTTNNSLTAKERIANLHSEQGDVKEALQIRCDILLTTIKELMEEHEKTLTTRSEIEERCNRLRPVAESLAMVQNLVQRFRRLSVNNNNDLLVLMRDIGKKLLTNRWRSSAFESIQLNAAVFGCRDAKTIAALCIAEVLPDKNMAMESLLGYIDVYKTLGRSHSLSTYVACAIVKCVVLLVVPVSGNRPSLGNDVTTSDEVVSLTDRCCGLVIGLFSMVDMTEGEKFWQRWDKFDDCRIECLSVLETIPCPLPVFEPEPEPEPELEVLLEPVTELDSAPDVFQELEVVKEPKSEVEDILCEPETITGLDTEPDKLPESRTAEVDQLSECQEDNRDFSSKIVQDDDSLLSLSERNQKLQSENKDLLDKVARMEALLEKMSEESNMLSGQNSNLREQIEIIKSETCVASKHVQDNSQNTTEQKKEESTSNQRGENTIDLGKRKIEQGNEVKSSQLDISEENNLNRSTETENLDIDKQTDEYISETKIIEGKNEEDVSQVEEDTPKKQSCRCVIQ